MRDLESMCTASCSVIEPRLERKLGQIPPDLMAKVKEALRFALEL
jgi:mRNA-degrading endonuclease toxin of MazEF toxin-antitoxin module